jgi:RNA polymerase primary sigma factor
MDRDRLAGDLERLLAAHPRQQKYQLLAGLTGQGWTGLSTTDVNSVLYERGRPFIKDDSTLPLWSLGGGGQAVLAGFPLEVGSVWLLDRYRGPEPRAWQQEALDSWLDAGRRGVVEAVTGTGKTTVGVIAAADAVARGRRVAVVVPGIDLLDQWHAKLTSDLPSVRVGRFGDRYQDSLDDHDVVVSTVQSAYLYVMLPTGYDGLLIADEVHHYGAEMFSQALEESFDERLGLTATYERSDNGVAQFLTPYFSSKRPGRSGRQNVVVAGCDYERGLADGILARFRVGLLGVGFSGGEQEEYEELDSKASRARSSLIKEYGCPAEPFGEFMRYVTALSEGGHGDGRAAWCARRYLSAFTKRRELLADCTRKLESLRMLSPVLAKTDRALVFTETVASAERAARTIREGRVPARAYTNQVHRGERKRILTDFRTGAVRALAAPRVLDEGVDVPEADLGVILAASHSRRQMIQRMGRVIRPKADGRPANFVILYVKGTSEDPAEGAHEAFLSEITGVADDVRVFPGKTKERDLLAWYMGR